MSNRDSAPRRLDPGIYGVGNTLLDAPEVTEAKNSFRTSLENGPAVDSLFTVLAPARIVNDQYGTRCSTILLRAPGHRLRYAERSFGADGAEGQTLQFELSLPARA
jgi:uncharacterized protein with NRDE domain